MNIDNIKFWDYADKNHGTIPRYLKEILTILGFTSNLAYEGLNESNMDKLMKQIEKKIKSSKNLTESDSLKILIQAELDIQSTDFDSFTLPFGHQLALESFVNRIKSNKLSSVIEDENKPTNEDSIANLKSKFEELTNQSIQKCVAEEIRSTEFQVDVSYENNSWYIRCPFCPHKKFKVVVERQAKCNITNIRNHFKFKHGQSYADDTENDTVMKSADDLTHSNVTKPALKSTEASGSSKQTQKDNLSNKTHESSEGFKSVQSTSEQSMPKKKVATKRPANSESISLKQPSQSPLPIEKKSKGNQNIDELLSNLDIPNLLKDFVFNANKNYRKITGRRYATEVKLYSCFIYIRGGLGLLENLRPNFVLPTAKTIRSYINNYNSKLVEGKVYAAELKQHLISRELPLEVVVLEDGTKISEYVEYDVFQNVLLGLVAPLQAENGFPKEQFFIANSASDVINNISNYKRASYVQVIIAKSLKEDSPYFIISYYATDNCFTFNHVSLRNLFIKNELQKFGITVLAFGSDGDTRFLKSQKVSMNYGIINDFCGFPVAGSMETEICSIQDPLHILKKLKTSLYDDCDFLRIGMFRANLTHLVTIFKQFERNEHNLILSDIDPYDQMNYSCLDKITSDSVISLLHTVKNADGTILFLELMKAIRCAYVNKDSSAQQKLFNATWSLHFIRLWKSWLLNNNISLKHFISSNSYECLEVNYIFLLKLIKLNKSEHIHYLNSQIVEGFFRKLRSFCGVEDLVVSSSIKGVLTRIQKIQTEEKIVSDLKQKYSFPKYDSQNVFSNENKYMSNGELAQTISRAVNFANIQARLMGIDTSKINMCDLVKEVKEGRKALQINQQDCQEDDNEEEAEDNEDFLNSVNDTVNLENIDQDIEDLTIHQPEIIEVQKLIFDKNESSQNSQLHALYNGRNLTISKNKLCSLLQNNKIRISSDIRRRFISKKDVEIRKCENGSFWIEESIMRGDNIVMYHKDEVFMGNVFNMQYCDNSTKSRRKFGKFSIELKSSGTNGLKVLLDPMYYVSPDLVVIEKNAKQFIDIKNYVCHASYEKSSILGDEKDILQKFLNDVISNNKKK